MTDGGAPGIRHPVPDGLREAIHLTLSYGERPGHRAHGGRALPVHRRARSGVAGPPIVVAGNIVFVPAGGPKSEHRCGRHPQLVATAMP
jgi:hypothetical protein